MANSTNTAIDLAVEQVERLKRLVTDIGNLVTQNSSAVREMFSGVDAKSLKELNTLQLQYNKILKETELLKIAQSKAIKDQEIADQRLSSIKLTNAKKIIDIKAKEQSIIDRLAKKEQDALVKTSSEISKQTERRYQLVKALQKQKAAENAVQSKAMTGRMVESVNAIGVPSQSLKALNQYYKELEISSAKSAKEQVKGQQDTENAIKKANRERIAEADAIERNKRALLNQKNATLELSRAYVQLVSQQQQAKKVLQDLIVSQGRNSSETIKAQKHYDSLTAKVNQANKATSNFSKGGLGSAIAGFKNLLGAFGFVGALQTIVGMGKAVFSLTKELNSMAFSMKTVIKDTSELIQTQRWLKEITNAYGADIVETTKRYIKFRAASKEANLSASETQKIFGTVTKAAGVLGLKTDELSGIYLALEQMISKGKVTTEELRRQLGERLPGAMDIMAKALGVTTSELDKMLKKGQVLSADALPKFVVQLEKAYGIESVTKVDTMVASQIRMNNAWKSLVISIEKDGGSISKIFKDLFEDLSDVLVQIERLNQSQRDLVETSQTNEYQESLTSVKEEWDAIVKHAEKTNQLHKIEQDGGYIRYLGRQKEIQEGLVGATGEELQLLFEKRKRLNEVNKELENTPYGKGAALNEEKALLIAQINGLQVEELKYGAMKGRLEALKELIRLETKTDNNKEDDDDEDKKYDFLKGSIAYYEKQISLAKDAINKTTLTNKEYERQAKIIEDLESKLKKLRIALGLDDVKTLDLKVSGLDLGKEELSEYQKKLIEYTDSLKKAEDIPELIPLSQETLNRLDEYNKKLLQTENAANKLKKLPDIFKNTMETFSDVFDIDLSKFDFLFDGLSNSVEQWADLSKELIGSVLDASLQRYDIELQTAQRNRDLILNNEFATEEQKQEARRQFEEKERKINTERAKKERENTLIKIAVDTASSIAQATTYLSNPITAPLFPGIVAAITGLGLAQAAIVASQPLPQFYEGVVDSKYEGLATKDEKGAEIQFDKYGNIKDLGQNKGAKLTHVAKGDTILTAEQSNAYLQRAIFEMNMQSNGDILSQSVVDKSLVNEIRSLKNSNEMVWTEVKKLANRPISNNVKVEIKENRPY